MPWLKPAVFLVAMAPGLVLLADIALGALGDEPVEASIQWLGRASLFFLLATLACTPARAGLGWTWPLRVRRMLGLFGYGYAVVHGLTFDVFVLGGIYLDRYVAAIVERPFIALGSFAAILLIPLFVTSTDGMVRRLGHRTWKRIHRLAYLATPVAVLHFLLARPPGDPEPLLYAVVLISLLGFRVVHGWRGRTSSAPGQARSSAEAR